MGLFESLFLELDVMPCDFLSERFSRLPLDGRGYCRGGRTQDQSGGRSERSKNWNANFSEASTTRRKIV